VSRLAIVAALEALEAGDQTYAVEVLLTALEDLNPEVKSPQGPRGVRCETCGLRFEWPGLLDHHRRFSHWSDDETIAA
jgi:hypothetical protein